METQLEGQKVFFFPKLVSQSVNQKMLLGFKHFPLAFKLLSSYSELSLPHPVFICKAEMKTLCSLQPPSSDPLPARFIILLWLGSFFQPQNTSQNPEPHAWTGTGGITNGCRAMLLLRKHLLVGVGQSYTLSCFTEGIINFWILLVHRCLLWLRWALVSYLLCPIDMYPSGTYKEGLILEQSQRLHKCK